MTAGKPLPGIDAFHRERSKCIDAFAAIEMAVVGLLDLAGQEAKSDCFGQKLERLKKIKAGPKISKQKHSELQLLLASCEMISALRNDIVHSALRLASIEDEKRACFVNARQCRSGSQTARLFSLEGMRKLSAEMTRLAKSLREIGS